MQQGPRALRRRAVPLWRPRTQRQDAPAKISTPQLAVASALHTPTSSCGGTPSCVARRDAQFDDNVHLHSHEGAFEEPHPPTDWVPTKVSTPRDGNASGLMKFAPFQVCVCSARLSASAEMAAPLTAELRGRHHVDCRDVVEKTADNRRCSTRRVDLRACVMD